MSFLQTIGNDDKDASLIALSEDKQATDYCLLFLSILLFNFSSGIDKSIFQRFLLSLFYIYTTYAM